MKCSRCGTEGVTFGHRGLCANDYAKYMAHQKELRDISIENRELLAARITHPSGKSPRWRAREKWVIDGPGTPMNVFLGEEL